MYGRNAYKHAPLKGEDGEEEAHHSLTGTGDHHQDKGHHSPSSSNGSAGSTPTRQNPTASPAKKKNQQGGGDDYDFSTINGKDDEEAQLRRELSQVVQHLPHDTSSHSQRPHPHARKSSEILYDYDGSHGASAAASYGGERGHQNGKSRGDHGGGPSKFGGGGETPAPAYNIARNSTYDLVINPFDDDAANDLTHLAPFPGGEYKLHASDGASIPLKLGLESEDEEFKIEWTASDPQHPQNWSVKRKWWILFIICTASLCVTAASSINASAYNQIQAKFGVPRVVAVLGVSLYVFGLGIGSLVLAPLSEFFGRRIIYLSSFAVFTILNIPIATANNIGVLLFFRLLTGLCGSGFLSIAGGSVSDLFKPGTTDIPVAIYTLSPLVGPAVGPIIGGFINQNASWRVTFYVILAWAGVEFVLLYLFVPETFLPVVLKQEAQKMRISTGNGKYYAPMEKSGRSVGDVFPAALYVPVQLVMAEKMALALDLWTSLVLGIIYLFFNAIPFTFRTVFGFNLQSTGLAFIAMGGGMVLGTLSQFAWVKQIRNAAALNGGKAPPESRLIVGMAGAVLVPVGLFWFSLTSTASVPWYMPLLGTVMFGAGAVYVFTAVFGFLVSTYPKYAASAMAGNTLIRCCWAAAFPLFADPLYRAAGPKGASGLLAFLALLMAPIPFVLNKRGPSLRAVSKYSS